MTADDTSTLSIGPLDTLAGKGPGGLPLVPALTIVWHPDTRKIGHLAPLTALLESDVASIHRDEPTFYVPGSTKGSSLDHRSIGRMATRGAVLLVRAHRKGFALERGRALTDVELDGQRFEGSREITSADLTRGLILTLGRRIVLCLHAVRFPVVRSPNFGLLGSSDLIEDVRRAIARAADRNLTVLLRGETGAGKELVAQALHQQSRRSAGKLVSVNMGELALGTATSELFGHEKGAFTGAVEARLGHFRAAHGGTLFLDEIALLPKEVQPVLLRVLQDHRIQPLGSSVSRPVDVRVVAATDAKLEKAIAENRFDAPLYFRLQEFTISLPPLRERREDIGVLLLYFLTRTLKQTDELSRLSEAPDNRRPWLTARTVARIALADWPGNVRQLSNLAARLVTSELTTDTDEITSKFLSEGTVSGERPDQGVQSRVPISRERLLRTLEELRWNQTHAAKALGVSRGTVWNIIGRHPEIRRLLGISDEKLTRELQECGGDLPRLSARLDIPLDVLESRVRSKKP